MYLIETERLRLRRLTEEDREAVHSVLLNKEIMDPMHLPVSGAFADDWLHRMIAHYQTHGPANWYAERKEDGAFIGIMGVILSEIDGVSCAELGYLVHPDFHRRGYALEGVKACMEYAFTVLNADYVTAAVASDNLPSIRLTEKLGLFPIQERLYKNGNQETLYILYGLNRPSDEREVQA